MHITKKSVLTISDIQPSALPLHEPLDLRHGPKHLALLIEVIGVDDPLRVSAGPDALLDSEAVW